MQFHEVLDNIENIKRSHGIEFQASLVTFTHSPENVEAEIRSEKRNLVAFNRPLSLMWRSKELIKLQTDIKEFSKWNPDFIFLSISIYYSSKEEVNWEILYLNRKDGRATIHIRGNADFPGLSLLITRIAKRAVIL